MLVTKTIGEDFIGSVKFGLAWCRENYRWLTPVSIRLHPLDQYLDASKWPTYWPPLVVDVKTPRHTAVIKLVDARQPTQPRLNLQEAQ